VKSADIITVVASLIEGLYILMNLTNYLLCSVSGRLAEYWPPINPVSEILVLVVVGWSVVVIRVVVVSDSMITDLSEDVDLSPRFARHLIG
jgi:hypothetical protein